MRNGSKQPYGDEWTVRSRCNAPKPKNKHKQSPIPWLALRMAIFNGCDCKQAQAKARATLADRLYALSQQERRRV